MKHQHEDRIGRSVPLEVARRQCLDKRRYETRNHARDAAAQNHRREGWAATRPYRCTLCAGWHLATVKDKQPIKAPQLGQKKKAA